MGFFLRGFTEEAADCPELRIWEVVVGRTDRAPGIGAGTMVETGAGRGRAIGGAGKLSNMAPDIGVTSMPAALFLLLFPLLWSLPDPDPFWLPFVLSRDVMSAIPRLMVSVLVPDNDSFSAVKNAVSVEPRGLTASSNADEPEIALFRPPLDLGRYEEGVDECVVAGGDALEGALSMPLSAGPDFVLNSAGTKAGSGSMGMAGR